MSGRTPSPTATISGVVGIVMYAATGFVYLTSGLVVPAPWLLPLWAVWVAGLYLLIRVLRNRRALGTFGSRRRDGRLLAVRNPRWAVPRLDCVGVVMRRTRLPPHRT